MVRTKNNVVQLAPFMKKLICIFALVALNVGSLVAEMSVPCFAPPPIELTEALSIAVKAFGTNSSQFHCVFAAANYFPLSSSSTNMDGQWSFEFTTTNHQQQIVWVSFRTKTAVTSDQIFKK
jgi:hypothetical protein